MSSLPLISTFFFLGRCFFDNSGEFFLGAVAAQDWIQLRQQMRQQQRYHCSDRWNWRDGCDGFRSLIRFAPRSHHEYFADSSKNVAAQKKPISFAWLVKIVDFAFRTRRFAELGAWLSCRATKEWERQWIGAGNQTWKQNMTRSEMMFLHFPIQYGGHSMGADGADASSNATALTAVFADNLQPKLLRIDAQVVILRC